MAPESPGNLVAIDLEWRNSRLECQVDRYDPTTALDFLYVSWNAIECPENYLPVGRGVAYVWVPPHYLHRQYRARVDNAGHGFEWIDKASGLGLMLIVTLPPDYTYVFVRSEDRPRPIRFKALEDGRMALYWWLKGEADGRAEVSWQMQHSSQMETESQSRLLNEEARHAKPSIAHPVHIDLPPGQGADKPSVQQPALKEAPSWHVLIEQVNIEIGATKMTDSHNQITVGDVTNSNVNIDSTLKNVKQVITESDTLSSNKKEELERLVEELKAALQPATRARPEEVATVTSLVETLTQEGIKPQKNSNLLQITGKGLKEAAQSLLDITPTVLTIVGQIVKVLTGVG
jgi:hypothetical protein